MAKAKKKSTNTDKPLSVQDLQNCQATKEEVEALLQKQCKANVHYLPKCCDCNKEHNGPLIRSHHDAVLLNTAYKAAGVTIPVPGPDRNWEFGPASTGPWTPAFVSGNVIPSNWTGTPPANADWLSNDRDGRPNGKQEVYFRRSFILCEGIDPSTFQLTVNYHVDDRVEEIFVNGVPQSAKVSIPTGAFTGQPKTVTIKDDWQTCENEIIFKVTSPMTYLGFIAGFTIAPLPSRGRDCRCECKEAELPKYAPCFSVSWGDGSCDNIETNDFEVLCITACNCYSNICFEDLTINRVTTCDEAGKPVPNLPDGSPSVELIPFGPICFGDLGPCTPGVPTNCKSRQLAIRSRAALAGRYRLKFEAVCYHIAYTGSTEVCFELELCQD